MNNLHVSITIIEPVINLYDTLILSRGEEVILHFNIPNTHRVYVTNAVITNSYQISFDPIKNLITNVHEIIACCSETAEVSKLFWGCKELTAGLIVHAHSDATAFKVRVKPSTSFAKQPQKIETTVDSAIKKSNQAFIQQLSLKL